MTSKLVAQSVVVVADPARRRWFQAHLVGRSQKEEGEEEAKNVQEWQKSEEPSFGVVNFKFHVLEWYFTKYHLF